MFLILFVMVFALVSALATCLLIKKGHRKFTIFCFRGALVLIFTLFLSIFLKSGISAADTGDEGSKAQVRVITDVEAGARSFAYGLGLIASSVTFAFSVIGGGIAMAAVLPSAIVALSENPKMFGKLFTVILLAETISILGFVMCVLLMNKVNILMNF
ncbi:MAG: V-type ATP synthase subunit C [Candidatus Improbicoccus pseudotrichonymphae]|uniref:V-type ATP synthase subunit C n=1 Tax=Candidatus Improbicoccus pseudotrichonymphae TaxID=3033792 RepID=A0AA48HY21_9FIRM|nr:MAG: V-type ATP synthase subunit C [Candidatus Improbicoccus pseudotrichonymphae]